MVDDELFAVPPGQFVKTRNELAKRLSAEDEKEEAKRVRGMRRPATGVWALNQLGREHPEAVEALLAAGRRVGEAQQRGSGGDLREANDALQRHVLDLARLAEETVVDKAVATAAPRREIESALRVAALGGEASELLRAGRLLELPEADEMAMWAAGDVESATDDETDSREIDQARDVLARAEAEAKRARELAEDLAQRVEDLEEALRRERADVEAAVREAEKKAQTAAKAEDRLQRLEA